MTGAVRRPDRDPNRRPKALIIDQDALSFALADNLEEHGVSVQRAYTQSQARALLRALHFDLVVCETALPDGEGEALFRETLPFLGSTSVIFVTRAAQTEQVVRLVRMGALDYVVKPYDALKLAQRIREATMPRSASEPSAPASEPKTQSPAMAPIVEQIKKLAGNNVGVLLVGEPGSGKKTIGRQLHAISSRRGEPFIELRSDSLVASDGERMLFGEILPSHGEEESIYVPGALEQAGAGTLFLDQIDELPVSYQTKLIQVIDEKKFRRIGDAREYVPFKARVISSSKIAVSELRQRISADLLYRLAVVEIEVPPLRSRREDIEGLVMVLSKKCAEEIGCAAPEVDPEVIAVACLYDWPGNVRELKNRLLRALSLGNGKRINAVDLFPRPHDGNLDKRAVRRLDEARLAAEQDQIVQALATTNGRIGAAARKLGISRVTLWTKMKRFGLQNDVSHVGVDE